MFFGLRKLASELGQEYCLNQERERLTAIVALNLLTD
jgi:hypothetical protein